MSIVIDLAKASRADQSIYDPTCGSGSLLLKAHDEAKNRTGLDLAIYGQEMDNATSALARMNMVLHDCPTAEVWQANRSNRTLKAQDGRRLRRYARRWLVERYFAWLQWKRCLIVRWKYYTSNFLSFVELASITMLLKRI